ncbi:ATP-binding protein [Sorangium cellulosum]|nr:ATP-binding protein [Sorangium cellulosum]
MLPDEQEEHDPFEPQNPIDQMRRALDEAFSPTSPIDRAALFSGRKEERRDLQQAIGQRGGHAILYGEPGVGKTSLSNIIVEEFRGAKDTVAVRIGCDSSDTFSTVWRKVFSEIRFVSTRRRIGFGAEPMKRLASLADHMDSNISPNDVRVALASLEAKTVLMIDEFDRIKPEHRTLFADMIKMCSDYTIPTTMILVGVADSVDSLLSEHASVARALRQVPMPRMKANELEEIVESGLASASMSIDKTSMQQIIRLSNGLPHYTHLLAQSAGHEALDAGSNVVREMDLSKALERAVKNRQRVSRRPTPRQHEARDR